MILYPEAHQRGSWLNPISGDWGSATNNPMCGYWWSLIISNNPPDLQHPFFA